MGDSGASQLARDFRSEVLGLGRLAALEGIRDRALLRRGFATGVSDYVVGSTENRISGSNPSFSAT